MAVHLQQKYKSRWRTGKSHFGLEVISMLAAVQKSNTVMFIAHVQGVMDEQLIEVQNYDTGTKQSF